MDLVRTAWGVAADKVVGGPDWVETDRFDVVATAPDGSSAETLRAMLQGLLKDRFGLVVHSTSKDFPAYAITAGKNPSLRTAAESKTPAGCTAAAGANPAPSRNNAPAEPVVFACRGLTMREFADGIPKMRGVSGYLLNYPVLHQTNLGGSWDFDVRWTPRILGHPTPTGPDTITIFDAFEK